MNHPKLLSMLFMMAAAFTMNAETYHFNLAQPAMLDGKELKPGSYTVSVNNNSAVIHRGKETVETKVREETTDNKYENTSVRFIQDGGKYTLQEIHVGGKKTKLVFEPSRPVTGGL